MPALFIKITPYLSFIQYLIKIILVLSVYPHTMICDEKKILRKKMHQIQKDYIEKLLPKEKFSLTENLCEKITSLKEYKDSDLILAYISDTLEADCIPVILDALEKGKKVAVPKVDSMAIKCGRSEMDFYFLENRPLEEQLEYGTYGIREPKDGLKKLIWGVAGTSPFVIVPGVAFTKDGKRLGHGKGFYDIYISEMKKEGLNPFLCGVCLPCQIVENLPADENDELMDKVVF